MKNRLVFLGMVAGALLLAQIPVVHWPFSWMETYFHEISHGLAALATGGRVVKIELHWGGSGLCWTQGGWSWLVTWFGYAGAVVWGAMLYWSATAADHRQAPVLAGGLLTLLGGSLLLWARDVITILVLLVIMAVIALQWRWQSASLLRWLLQFSGVYVLLSAVRAPLALVDGRHLGDGATLANKTHIPEIFWVAQWEIIALATLWLLWRTIPATPEEETPGV